LLLLLVVVVVVVVVGGETFTGSTTALPNEMSWMCQKTKRFSGKKIKQSHQTCFIVS
jgi:hypothetical protein